MVERKSGEIRHDVSIRDFFVATVRTVWQGFTSEGERSVRRLQALVCCAPPERKTRRDEDAPRTSMPEREAFSRKPDRWRLALLESTTRRVRE